MTLAALGLPVPLVQQRQLPGPLPPDLDRVAGPAGRPRGPLQRPDAGAPPAPALCRPVGVAVVDGADHVQPAHRRGAVRLRLHPRPADPGHRHRDAGLDPVLPLPADPPRARAPARPRALLHEAEVRRPRGDHPEARDGRRSQPSAAGAADGRPRATTEPMPIEIRRFGVGHRRPDGPPGTVRRHRPGHPRRWPRPDRELAFARGARIEPHSNPNTSWFVVIEGGGWVGVGEERTRVAAGEAVLWPADVPHAAWTEHSEMRAFMVEFAGADDSAIGGVLESRTRTLTAGGAGRSSVATARCGHERSRRRRSPDSGRAGLSSTPNTTA